MSEKLTRKELLELLNQSVEQNRSLDELDQKALEGYEYLDNDHSAENALDRLDARFNQWVEQKEVSKVKKGRTRTMLILQRVAAVILVLLIPTVLIFQPGQSKRLANRYFEAPRSTYVMLNRGDQATEQTSLNEAFTLYEKGEFSKAAIAIENLVADNPEKKDLKFYQAISLYASGQIEESIPLLESCTTEPYQELDERSPWYLGLAYLKKGERDQAIIWLQKAAEVDALHEESALKLLNKID
ncbi:MAG: hypothetical protein KDC80_07640 [Saprospiraceae bacterium]|nr:hypothetical protein [Saprospiraceae bacterium]